MIVPSELDLPFGIFGDLVLNSSGVAKLLLRLLPSYAFISSSLHHSFSRNDSSQMFNAIRKSP